MPRKQNLGKRQRKVSKDLEDEASSVSSQKYVVERILDHRVDKRRKEIQFRVKWEDYPESEATWEDY